MDGIYFMTSPMSDVYPLSSFASVPTDSDISMFRSALFHNFAAQHKLCETVLPGFHVCQESITTFCRRP